MWRRRGRNTQRHGLCDERLRECSRLKNLRHLRFTQAQYEKTGPGRFFLVLIVGGLPEEKIRIGDLRHGNWL